MPDALAITRAREAVIRAAAVVIAAEYAQPGIWVDEDTGFVWDDNDHDYEAAAAAALEDACRGYLAAVDG